MKFLPSIAFVSITTFYLFIGYSCHSDDNKDYTKPTVKIEMPKDGDTIYIDSTTIFKGIFSDNNALSSYFIEISNPNIKDENRIILNPKTSLAGDSVIYMRKVITGLTNIFGIRDTAVTVVDAFIPDSVQSLNSGLRGPYPVVRGPYQFKVVVMDVDGNKDSTSIKIELSSPVKKIIK